MPNNHWELLAAYLSGNATEDQQNALVQWLESAESEWTIFGDVKIIWNLGLVQPIDFDSQKAIERLFSK